jgi:hypothetical protein
MILRPREQQPDGNISSLAAMAGFNIDMSEAKSFRRQYIRR